MGCTYGGGGGDGCGDDDGASLIFENTFELSNRGRWLTDHCWNFQKTIISRSRFGNSV